MYMRPIHKGNWAYMGGGNSAALHCRLPTHTCPICVHRYLIIIIPHYYTPPPPTHPTHMTAVYADHLRDYREWCRVFCTEQLVHLSGQWIELNVHDLSRYHWVLHRALREVSTDVVDDDEKQRAMEFMLDPQDVLVRYMEDSENMQEYIRDVLELRAEQRVDCDEIEAYFECELWHANTPS